MSKVYYKIVEAEKGKFKTLFHGINRSRTLPCGEWVTATKKMVSDGPNSTKYLSGLHILEDREKAKKYLQRFKNKDNKYIVACVARGIRPKEHSRDDVYLADKIFII